MKTRAAILWQLHKPLLIDEVEIPRLSNHPIKYYRNFVNGTPRIRHLVPRVNTMLAELAKQTREEFRIVAGKPEPIGPRAVLTTRAAY